MQASLPVSLHHIYKVVCCDITPQGDISIVDLILGQDALHRFTVQFSLGTLG